MIEGDDRRRCRVQLRDADQLEGGAHWATTTFVPTTIPLPRTSTSVFE